VVGSGIVRVLTSSCYNQFHTLHEVIEIQMTTPENVTPEGEEALKRIDAVLEALTAFSESQATVNEKTDEHLAKIDERLDRSNGRFDKIEQHLGYLRGAHAGNAARRNASLIADDMGYQVITALPREELIGFAKIAHDGGKAENAVRGFREADLVMLVRDINGHPAYIAVEASFTVANTDIQRA
jgi:hypothetical protein